MLAVRLRARGRNGPHPMVHVDLRPRSPADLAAAGRCQHQEFERQLHERLRVRGPHLSDRGRNLGVRQRPHVLYHIVLRAECRADPVTGVVRPEFHRDGPFHDRPDALAGASGRWSPSGARSEPESRSRRRSSPPRPASRRFGGRHGAPNCSATAGHGGGSATPDSVDPGAAAPPRRRSASTRPAASSDRGWPPSRASFRFANAFSRASFRETRGYPAEPELGSAAPGSSGAESSPGSPWAGHRDKGRSRRSIVRPGSRCGRRPA